MDIFKKNKTIVHFWTRTLFLLKQSHQHLFTHISSINLFIKKSVCVTAHALRNLIKRRKKTQPNDRIKNKASIKIYLSRSHHPLNINTLVYHKRHFSREKKKTYQTTAATAAVTSLPSFRSIVILIELKTKLKRTKQENKIKNIAETKNIFILNYSRCCRTCKTLILCYLYEYIRMNHTKWLDAVT